MKPEKDDLVSEGRGLAGVVRDVIRVCQALLGLFWPCGRALPPRKSGCKFVCFEAPLQPLHFAQALHGWIDFLHALQE